MGRSIANATAIAALMTFAAGAAACGDSITPTAPSILAPAGAHEMAATNVASAVAPTNSDPTMQIQEVPAAADVESVASSSRAFSSWWNQFPCCQGNPFPCCQNPFREGGFITNPAPTVVIVISNGSTQVTNGGTMAVNLNGGSVTVQFGVNVIGSNVSLGCCSHVWTVDGVVVSNAQTGLCRLTRVGTHAVSVRVTNTLNVSTIAGATVVVR